MNDDDMMLHRILTAAQTGTVVCRLAERLDIPVYEAFRKFFSSRTYANFRIPHSYISMLPDNAIIDEFLAESRE